jgi:hypothetical protein
VTTVQKVLRIKTIVKSGGRIHITDPALQSGDNVEVIILLPATPSATRRSALDILAETPGQRIFKTAADVDHYLAEERAAWDD